MEQYIRMNDIEAALNHVEQQEGTAGTSHAADGEAASRRPSMLRQFAAALNPRISWGRKNAPASEVRQT